ncbi:hypothetical protein K449DRAFT_448705 [Hypoxylon sp. EC38]|nr:hypothetical protein K449DRAFT_448705 [Hypoxylon sp. EC38]
MLMAPRTAPFRLNSLSLNVSYVLSGDCPEPMYLTSRRKLPEYPESLLAEGNSRSTLPRCEKRPPQVPHISPRIILSINPIIIQAELPALKIYLRRISKMVSMESLANEIRAMIVHLIYDSSPRTMASLSLVNKSFNTLVRYRKFQAYTFHDESLHGDLSRIEQSGMWHVIQRIKITERLASGLIFSKYLAKMTGLTDIELECKTLHQSLKGTLMS